MKSKGIKRLWLNDNVLVCQADKGLIVLLDFFVSVTQARDIGEEKISTEKIHHSYLPVSNFVRVFATF